MKARNGAGSGSTRDRWTVIAPRVAVVGILLLAACDRQPGEAGLGEWRAQVDTIGDTVSVRTLSGSRWGDTAALVPEITIGSIDGPDEYVIGAPTALAVGARGTIYVLDAQIPALRAYGPDGMFLRNVGRAGNGPGEYESPDGVAVLPDGRVLVRDPPNSRITVFDSAGTHLTEWSLSGGFNSDRRFYTDTLGNSYVTALLERGLAPWQWKFGLVRYSASGEIVDTVPAPDWDYEPARVTASRGSSSSARRVPFTPEAVWSYSPLGYMVGGLSTQYRIDLYREGKPVLRIEREVDPVPVESAEADERVRRITEGLRRQYGSWRWNGPDVPATKPAFRNLFLTGEGDIWVLVSREGVPTMTLEQAREEEAAGRLPVRFTEPPAFDVFDEDGTYMGHVDPPHDLRMEPEPIVIGDRVWAITRDELDVPSVVRFRISRSPREPTG